MQQHRSFKYLMDILICIERIEEFSTELLDFEAFKSDLRTRLAIERCLEIIGEATNQLLKLEPDVAISHTEKMIGLRNRITHGYDDSSEISIWEIIKVHLPILKSEVQILLS